jgi:hypothetical protein
MKSTAPFSKAAIRNACIAAAFAVPPAALLGLSAIGSQLPDRPVTQQEMTDHANKLQAKRDKLAGKSTKGMSNYDACLKNKADLNALQAGLGDKSMDCDHVKKWKTPAQRIAAAGGQSKLIRACERSFRSSLKDPGSYRYQNANIIMADAKRMTVMVNYTATNSFGGRIQEVQTCTFKG